MATARLWGCQIRRTKLPSNISHWQIILRVFQVFRSIGGKTSKVKEARERKRQREVAELIREREAARKRRR